jgi:hypothetical protein
LVTAECHDENEQEETAMKFRRGRALFYVAASGLLSAAASVDWQKYPGAEPVETKTTASPATCASFGCLAADDPKHWAPFFAVSIVTMFGRAPR